MSNAYAVIGCQYGSEAKGNIAGYLALQRHPDTVVHNWSPNAGHSVITATGRKLIHSMLPMSIISPSIKTVLIGPGAVLDIAKMAVEIEQCRDILIANNIRIIVHPAAAIVIPEDFVTEQAYVTIGSTMKGSAAAAMRRMKRDPSDKASTVGQYFSNDSHLLSVQLGWANTTISASGFSVAIMDSEMLAIEGCQGFSLSMYHGFYPYSTSRDTSVNQLLADCAIPRNRQVDVIGCIRPYPIRVANRRDVNGKMIGYSGPCFPDQTETSWDQLGLAPEFTTVTKLERRVFTFSMQQVQEACYINSVDHLALSFTDYLTQEDCATLVYGIEDIIGVPVSFLSNGPSVEHVRKMPTRDMDINAAIAAMYK